MLLDLQTKPHLTVSLDMLVDGKITAAQKTVGQREVEQLLTDILCRYEKSMDKYIRTVTIVDGRVQIIWE